MVATRNQRLLLANTSSSGKVAPPEKQVSTITTASPNPSEIPKKLYDLIQRAAKCRNSLKLNSNNRFAKRKLKHYEFGIPIVAMHYQHYHELPSSWEYNPETSFMAHVPKPPIPPKPKTKKKKKKIRITWSSPNYHGNYRLNNEERKVWNKFRLNDTAGTCLGVPKDLIPVVDDMVVDLLGKFAVGTFNKSCQMYVNKDEDHQVSGAEFMEVKYFKLTSKYIFHMIIEAIEQGKPGVYEARVECVPHHGARTLRCFVLTHREPEWKRPWVKPLLESESEYETVQDGSSDPQDFYMLTGLVHRRTKGGGFNYHNPSCAPHRSVHNYSSKKNSDFVPNVSRPLPGS